MRLLLIALLAETAFATLNLASMPHYLRSDRLFSPGMIAIIMASFMLAEAVLKSPLGHLADRVGCRRLLVIAPLLSAGSAVLTILAPRTGTSLDVAVMIGLRLVDGAAAAMIWPAMFSAMGETSDQDLQQESLSLLNSCYFVGIALAFPISGFINQLFGATARGVIGQYAPSFLLAFVMFVACAVVAATSTLPQKVAHHEDPSHEPGNLLDAFRRIPQFMIMGAVVFVALGLPMTIIQFFAKDQLKLSQAGFGALVLPGAIAMALLSAPISKLGKRLGTATSVHLGLAICLSGMIVIALGQFIPALRTLLAFGIAGLPLGLGFLLAIPAWYTSVSEVDPARRGSNIGAVMAAQGLGAIVGGIIGGKIYGLGSAYGPFILCAIALAVSLALSYRLIPPPPKAQPEIES
ncbi:MAG: MFS transporter [Chthonomonas sp.]|nr:MFS transporter [Chthonomonas sp.]